MRNVRIRYQKNGMIRFTSHLDTMRMFSRAFSRTDIAVYYTEGFNPHPYLVLGLPLSLGFESECDLCDFRVENEEPLRDIVAKLQRVLPDGIQITAAGEPKMPLRDIAYVEYESRIYGDAPYQQADAAAVKRLLDCEEIEMEKKSKRGIQKVNIRPLIDAASVALGREGEMVLHTILSAGNENLNPELIVQAVQNYCPELPVRYSRHKRLSILTESKEIFE